MQGYTSRGIRCWSGNDDEAFDARHSAGAVGAISVASNLFPGEFLNSGLGVGPYLNLTALALFCEEVSTFRPSPLCLLSVQDCMPP